jgi:hypothetical protein
MLSFARTVHRNLKLRLVGLAERLNEYRHNHLVDRLTLAGVARDDDALIQVQSAAIADLAQTFLTKRFGQISNDLIGPTGSLQFKRAATRLHAYKKRDLGSFEEWRGHLRTHLEFIRTLDLRLPYQ